MSDDELYKAMQEFKKRKRNQRLVSKRKFKALKKTNKSKNRSFEDQMKDYKKILNSHNRTVKKQIKNHFEIDKKYETLTKSIKILNEGRTHHFILPVDINYQFIDVKRTRIAQQVVYYPKTYIKRIFVNVHSKHDKPTVQEMNEAVDEKVRELEREYKHILSMEVKYDELQEANVDLNNVKMNYISTNSYTEYNNINGFDFEKYMNKDKNDKHCVLRYILYEFMKADKKMNKETLIKEFQSVCDIDKGVSVDDILKWKNTFNHNVSIYSIDPFHKVHFKEVFNREMNKSVVLCFVNNNNHCYPILDKDVKMLISHTNELKLPKLSFEVKYETVKHIKQSIYTNDALDEGVDEFDNEIDQDYEKLINGEIDNIDCVILDGSIEQLIADIAGKHNRHCVKERLYINSSGIIEKLVHPINNILIVVNDDFEGRLSLSKALMKVKPCLNFEFVNQSYSQLAGEVCKIFEANYEKSFDDNLSRDIYKKYEIKPLIRTLTEEINGKVAGFDINSSYPTAILTCSDLVPVFNICDTFVPYDGSEIVCGEYLIDAYMNDVIGIVEDAQVQSYGRVKWLLDNKFITKNDIIGMKKASSCVSIQPLREVVKFIDSLEVDKFSKKMCKNSMIGVFGQKYHSEYLGCVSSSFDVISGLFLKHHNTTYNIKKINDLFYFTCRTKTPLLYTLMPLYRHIISESKNNLERMILECFDENTQLIGYNTDAIYVTDPKANINFKINEHLTFKCEEFKPKKYREYELKVVDNIDRSNLSIRRWNRIDENDCNDMSFCCLGMPGSGKSTLLKKIHDDDSVALCYTNKACSNLTDLKTETVHSYLGLNIDGEVSNVHKKKKVKKIQIDEYANISVDQWQIIYELKNQGYTIIFQCFGDENQTKPFTGKMSFKNLYKYSNYRFFRELCGYNLIEKKYISGCGRYDDKAYQLLNMMLKSQNGFTLPDVFKKTDDTLTRNLCKFNSGGNKTAFEINNRFIKDKGYYVNMELIGNINKGQILNSDTYYIHEILDNHFIVKDNKKEIIKDDNDVPIMFPKSWFSPTYALTVYKYQGGEIKEPYNIFDVEKMTANELYVAISRCKKLDDVHIDFDKIKNKTFYWEKEISTLNKLTMRKPKLVNMYRLINNERKIEYIGSTKRDINVRFDEHMTNNKNLLQYGNNWRCELIGVCYVNSKKERENVEYGLIKKYQNIDNGYQVVNKLCIEKNIEAMNNKIKRIYQSNIDEFIDFNIDEFVPVLQNNNGYRIKIKQEDIKVDVIANSLDKIKLKQSSIFHKYFTL